MYIILPATVYWFAELVVSFTDKLTLYCLLAFTGRTERSANKVMTGTIPRST